MSAAPLFPPRLLAGAIAAAALICALSLHFMTRLAPPGDDQAVGPNSYSPSAVGYAGIAGILEGLGDKVVKSQGGAVRQAGTTGVLVIAEPDHGRNGLAAAQGLLAARNVLLILPKWQVTASEARPGWVGKAEPIFPPFAQAALDLAAPDAELTGPQTVERWATNELAAEPAASQPLRLVKSKRLRPVVGSADGMLVGERVTKGRRLWVLSDPDVIENHGLARPANAAFAVALIDALRATGGPIVFDETVHGFETHGGSPLVLLFRPPLVYATLLGLATLGLLLWASLFRFGPPVPGTPALLPGKQGLVRNTAALLDVAGHQAALLRRYVQASLQDAGRQIHAPAGLDDRALARWLQRAGSARGVAQDCAALADEAAALAAARHADPADLAALARRAHLWKQEILNGAARTSRAGRGHPG